MLQILYKYLLINKKASIPGIGVFYIHRLPASYDFSNKTFIPPSASISFINGDVIPEKKFYSFLSKDQQIDEQAAVTQFTGFTQGLKESLQSTGTLDLPGFGCLSKDVTGKLEFRPEKPLPSFFTAITTENTVPNVLPENSAEPALTDKVVSPGEMVNEGSAKSGNKKDYWWVYAIILAAIAIAAIIYYYKINGTLR